MLRIAIVIAVLATFAPSAGASESKRQDVGTLDKPAIVTLQRRLTEAGCYKGPLDGIASPETKAAVDACPDQRPFLRIETGMHVANSWNISVDAQCRLLATGSLDKTVRLWALPDGRALRVVRWPVGKGAEGIIFAVALSPDGRFLAVGGVDAHAIGQNAHTIFIYEAASGAFVARVGAAKDTILAAAFSPDGRFLAFTSQVGGVHLVETTRWREIAADPSYLRKSLSLAFGPDGALYTTDFDGTLRRYAPGAELTKTAQVRLRGPKPALTVAVDPNGKRLAVGFGGNPTIDLYDAATLAYRGRADTPSAGDGDFASLAWRSDGRALIGGGGYGKPKSTWTLLFDPSGRRIGRPVVVASNRITALQPCGSGFAFASSEPKLGLLDAKGNPRLTHATAAVDMRRKLGGLWVTADAKTVRFGLGWQDANPVAFDLAKGTLSDGPAARRPFGRPIVRGLPVKNWDGSRKPTFAGRPISDSDEVSRTLAVKSPPTGFALGTSLLLRTYDDKGTLRWSKPTPNEVWGLNFSGDGRIIVAATGDGIIHWHRWSDGEELLSLFVNRETRAWVAWTPSGYYAASPGGEDMIGWHVNRGWTQAADFFPASKFRDSYARPDIVRKILDTLDEDAAVREANAARGGRQEAAAPITDRLPPVVSILAPADNASVVGDTVSVDYLVRSPSGQPVDAVEALVDGRPAGADRGLGRVTGLPDAVRTCLAQTNGAGRTEGGLQGCRGSLAVRLPPGTREVGLFARGGDRTSDVVRVRIARAAAAAQGDEILKPKLYALVVGISAYANKDYALGFAAKDAADFAATIARQKGGLYDDVTVRTLTDGQATERAIKDGLDWLTRQVTSRDVGLVYLAGHGMQDERDRFYFLAADSDAARLRATAVPREDIADALDSLAGKALLFLDACHAGAIAGTSGRRGIVDINGVINDFTRTDRGVVAFAASTGRQVSQENSAWGNGAFTKAVIEGLGLPGLKAGADYRGDGKITTSELDAYVTERVKSLTGGAQSPVMIRPATVPDFPLAVSR